MRARKRKATKRVLAVSTPAEVGAKTSSTLPSSAAAARSSLMRHRSCARCSLARRKAGSRLGR